MGYIRHHAILITCFNKPSIEAAHEQALSIFKEEHWADMVSPIVEAPVNGYMSFAIFPDGSKEGWNDSDKGDSYRVAFIEWLRQPQDRYFWDWALVQYGDDEEQTIIVDHSDIDVSSR